MGHYGTWVIACSPDRLLPNIPEVRTAFGSGWHEFTEFAGGWQILRIMPLYHEWPSIESGAGRLASILDKPMIAVWVSESACARFVGYTPQGEAWSAHVLAYEEPLEGAECGFDHEVFATLRIAGTRPNAPIDLNLLLPKVLAWAGACGFRAVDEAGVAEAFAGSDFNGHDRVERFAEAMGLIGGADVEPFFEMRDGAWWECWLRAQVASRHVCAQWSIERNGDNANEIEPGDLEHVQFLSMVSASMFGAGHSHSELAAEAARLDALWGKEGRRS